MLPSAPVRLFYSYSHKDEALQEKLEAHLSVLQNQGVINGWHDRRIAAGTDWEGDISEHLNSAGVILLLVSADFLASRYCWDVEISRAMERHEAGTARVIPVILRPCDWQSAPFRKLQALPKNGKPVTTWVNREEAFADIARSIRIYVTPKRQGVPKIVPSSPPSINAKLKVVLSIDLSYEEFNLSHQQLLQIGLAAFLRIAPEDVTILEVASGSVRVTIELPAEAVQRLLQAFFANDGTLFQALNELPLTDVTTKLPAKPNSPKVVLRPAARVERPVDVRVHRGRLPKTPSKLFGRDGEIDRLTRAWHDANKPIVTLVGDGGAGKSSVVNQWLARMAQHGYRGATRVYCESFYRQESDSQSSSRTSADQFIRSAIEWFFVACPATSTPVEKGEKLADAICQEPTILVLDGLEPLQREDGSIEDDALAALVRTLAAQPHRGLCVIATRRPVLDIADAEGKVVKKVPIDKLSERASVQLLKETFGVSGSHEELAQACREFGNHALALTLLGAYLKRYCGGAVAARHREPLPTVPPEWRAAEHAHQIMSWHADRLKDKPELGVLRLLGMFDRPANLRALKALCRQLPIPGLTDHLIGLPDAKWDAVLEALRDDRLVARANPGQPGQVDAHPLVRLHFGRDLRREQPGAWCEGHSRLYDYLRDLWKTPHGHAKKLPDTADGLSHLYSALFHGCQAGRYKEAWDEVYMSRILRGPRVCFATRELGLFGEDLAALAGFFESPWDQPVGGLSERRQSFLLAMVGSRLRALGLLEQAVAPTKQALEMYKQQNAFEWAAHKARHLAELHLAQGGLDQAEAAAEEGVNLADQSGIAYERYAELATLGAVLHHLGKPAWETFQEAERILREEAHYPHLDYLYSLWGFRYCDFLIDEGKDEEARELGLRMQQMTAEGHTRQDPETGLGLISVGLEWLVLGRAGLHRLKSGQGVSKTSVREELDHAVTELRRAGRAEFIPQGHLSRAAFRRLTGDYEGGRADLNSALAVIERSGMLEHKVDYLLELAWLELTTGQRTQAEHALGEARALIEEIGYGRRRRDLKALEGELLKGQGRSSASKKVLYYVSGHGHGHATRAGEIIREMANSQPEWAVYVTTTADERFFPVGLSVQLRRPMDEIDAGVAELDPLTVDAAATLIRVEALHRNHDRIVNSEESFVRKEGIDLIVADIPWLSGYVAEACEVPCLGVGNFTWDWIYEPFLADNARWAPLLQWVRGGYARMETYLRLPFSHPVSGFGQVVEMPLVARRRGTDRETARRALHVSPGETRRLVLLGMRGTDQWELLDSAARAGPDYLFVCPETMAGPWPGNVLSGGPATGLGFPDLVIACDVVVGKLGYGLLAEAVTAGTAILYPPRVGFREDNLLRAAAGQYARAREISLVDLRSGRWSPHLEELLEMRPPPQSLEPNGAVVCAAEIVRRIER